MLRRAAAGGFEALVTADQNIQFQQNLALSPIPVIVLVAPSNALPDLLPLLPAILQALPAARPGEVRLVGAS